MHIYLRNISQYKTLSLDITIQAGSGPGGRCVREKLDPLHQIDIGGFVELDEVNRNADIRALVASGLLTVTAVREPRDLDDSDVPLIGETDGSGIVHVYISATVGSDSTGTGTAAQPFATLAFGISQVDEWLVYGSTGDIVVHLSGVFTESLNFSAPRVAHRIVFEGNRDTMSILASGTMTAGSTTLITDAGATFGILQELSCYPAAVWDPADEVGTKQWTIVRWHNGTTWEPASAFLGGTPAAGWRYAIYRPSTRVAPVSDLHPALRVDSPTSFNSFSGGSLGFGGLGIMFRWIEFERDAPLSNPYEPVALVSGGLVQFSGCVIRGAALGMNIARGDVLMSGAYSWEEADLLFGFNGTFNFSEYGCGCGFIVDSGGYMGVYSQQSTLAATFVIRSTTHGIFVEGGFAQIDGAIHNGDVNSSWGATTRIASVYTHPMRISDHHQGCVTAISGGIVEVFSAILESAERSGFQVFGGDSAINLYETITVGAGGLARWGIDCRDGGKVSVAETTLPFVGTLGSIAVDGNDYTWPDLLAHSPLVGSRSGASVGLAVDIEGDPPFAEFQADTDGIHRIYVDGTAGDDANDGTSTRPVATVQHACDRVRAFIKAGPPDRDIVVHISDGTYAEDVVLDMPVMPLRRLLITADRDTMTVLASGTLTDALNNTVTDAGATLGDDTYAGYWIRLKEAGVERLTLQIRDHTSTVVTLVRNAVGSVPAAGWTYEILAPSVTIRSLKIIQPNPAAGFNGTFWTTTTHGPGVVLIGLTLGPVDLPAYTSLMLQGGDVYVALCNIVGHATNYSTPVRIMGEASLLTAFLYSDSSSDPFYGLTGNRYVLAYCGPRVSVPNGDGIRVDNGNFNGLAVVVSTPGPATTSTGIVVYDSTGSVYIWGGACHNCAVKGTGGNFNIGPASSNLYFLIKGWNSYEAAIHFDRDIRAEIQGVILQDCAAPFASAHHGSTIELGVGIYVTSAECTGDSQGNHIKAYKGGRIGLWPDAYANMDTTLQCVADNTVRSLSTVLAGTPLHGVNGSSIYWCQNEVVNNVDSDGVINYYVDGSTGDDNNQGIQFALPVRTLHRVIDLVRELLRTQPANDIRVNISGDVFAESVKLDIPMALRGRLLFEGDKAGMTLLASGTVDLGTATTITDADGSFGVGYELCGYPIKVWDPADEAGTASWTAVGTHTDTVIRFAGTVAYVAVPAPGWSYAVYRPATRIIGTGLGPSMDIRNPTPRLEGHTFNVNKEAPYVSGGNGIIFRWIEFERGDTYDAVNICVSGGCVNFAGCVASGIAQSLNAQQATINLFGPYPAAAADPFLGMVGYDYSQYPATLGVRRTQGGLAAIELTECTGGSWLAVYCPSHAVWMYRSEWSCDGVCVGGEIGVFRQSMCRISSLLIQFVGFGGAYSHHHGVMVGQGDFWGSAICEIWNLELDDITLNGIDVNEGSRCNIYGPVTTGPGGIDGYALHIHRGGQARLNDGVSWTATTGEILIDEEFDGTFAALTPGAPLEGSSGSRVYRHPVY